MRETNTICGTNNLTYGQGYIMLECSDYSIPETFTVDGITLKKKTNFHVSLLCVKNFLSVAENIEAEILKYFCQFQQEHGLCLTKFTGDFRLAKDGANQTLVALCEISNLNKFADFLSEKINYKIPYQPTHVTLYTLIPDKGIGLNNIDDLEHKSKSITVPKEILTALS